jgi:hypothetical protein
VVWTGTGAAGDRLAIQGIAAACWGVAFETEFQAPKGRQDCPVCGVLSSRFLLGRELSQVSVELIH